METKRKIYIITTFTLVIFASVNLFAQQNYLNKSKKEVNYNKKQSAAVSSVFNEIESGINGGNINHIAEFLSPQTYLSLSNGANGYYSSNQAFYVLEDFLRIYKITSFHFQNIQTHDNTPYATGIYRYHLKGKKDSANVYISLKKIDKNWKITQITIN